MGKFYQECEQELTLYVRQSAWLNTVPEKKELSRLEQMRNDGVDPPMPECEAIYLAEYLWQAGPTEVGGMGPAPLSHEEIAAWQANTGIDLTSWEARMLRALSLVYLNESHEAKKPARPQPWMQVLEIDRELVARKIKGALRG